MLTDAVAADPHDVLVESEEATERMKRALLAMGDRERRVLLAHRCGQPLGQIARELRISETDAQRCLIDACQQL
jgi:DNA-directed RNA polymerase specialized sigma24 family protein